MFPDTQSKGDHAELRVAAKLRALGWTILQPFGDNEPYDLVAERDSTFVRIQVKSSTMNGDSVTFFCYCSNSSHDGSGRTTYDADDIDGFAVYSSEQDECFWVPIDDANEWSMALNTQDDSAVNPASEYRLVDYFSS